MRGVTINSATPAALARDLHNEIMSYADSKKRPRPSDDTTTHDDDASGLKNRIRFLYVTPEKISKSKRFMQRLERIAQAGYVCELHAHHQLLRARELLH